LDFQSYGGYYESELSSIMIGERHINTNNINLMFDSGTTFTHFPNKLIK